MESHNILDITFDRMTILGELGDNRAFLFNRLLNKFTKKDVPEDKKIHVTDTRYHDYARGKFLGDLVYFEYDKLKAKTFKTRNFRMEFNPNKLTSEQIKWLQDNVIPILSEVGITRLDLAIDVNFDLSRYQFIPIGSSRDKSTVTFRNATGKLETLYIGKRESDKMIRLYNKKLEQKKKGNEVDFEHWWRLEFELKRETINEFTEVFEVLQIKKPNVASLAKVQDRAMLTYLESHPDEWAELSKPTRSKYKKMLREIKEEDITYLFDEGLKKKKAELSHQLDEWFKNQYRVFETNIL